MEFENSRKLTIIHIQNEDERHDKADTDRNHWNKEILGTKRKAGETWEALTMDNYA